MCSFADEAPSQLFSLPISREAKEPFSLHPAPDSAILRTRTANGTPLPCPAPEQLLLAMEAKDRYDKERSP